VEARLVKAENLANELKSLFANKVSQAKATKELKKKRAREVNAQFPNGTPIWPSTKTLRGYLKLVKIINN